MDRYLLSYRPIWAAAICAVLAGCGEPDPTWGTGLRPVGEITTAPIMGGTATDEQIREAARGYAQQSYAIQQVCWAKARDPAKACDAYEWEDYYREGQQLAREVMRGEWGY